MEIIFFLFKKFYVLQRGLNIYRRPISSLSFTNIDVYGDDENLTLLFIVQRESGRIEEDSPQIPLHVKLRVFLTQVRVGVEISSLAGRRRGKGPNRGR